MSVPNSPSENPDNLWERWNKESAIAFEAFNGYLALPAKERTLYAAYCANQQEIGKKPAKQAPGQWTLWSTLFQWKDRAVAYDNHVAHLARQAQEEQRKAHVRRLEQEHLEKLTGYRDQLHDLNAAAMTASVLLLGKCVERLQTVTEEDIQKLPLDKLGNLLKAASTAAVAASSATASALAVDELIGLLDEQKSDPED